MNDLLFNLFTMANTQQQANAGSQILVDFYATTTPTNTLTPGQEIAPICYPLGTLLYTPSHEINIVPGVREPASFGTYPGNLGPSATIVGFGLVGSRRGPEVLFENVPVVPTTPPLASPTNVNVDATTSVIFGVAGSLFVTITLCNLRTQARTN